MAEELFREQAGSAASAKESPRSSTEREEGGQLSRDRSDRWADIYEDMPVRCGSISIYSYYTLITFPVGQVSSFKGIKPLKCRC